MSFFANPAVRMISIPTIETLKAELDAMHAAGVGLDVPIDIQMIANAPGAFVIREVEIP